MPKGLKLSLFGKGISKLIKVADKLMLQGRQRNYRRSQKSSGKNLNKFMIVKFIYCSYLSNFMVALFFVTSLF
jgi:hypothetical protein